jgi:hypothetical protein
MSSKRRGEEGSQKNNLGRTGSRNRTNGRSQRSNSISFKSKNSEKQNKGCRGVKTQADSISEQIAMDPSFRTIQTLELDDLGAMLNQGTDQNANRSKSKSKPRKSRNPKKDHKISEPAFYTTKNDRFVLNDINFGNDKKSYRNLGDKKRKTENFTKKQNVGRPEVHRNDGQPLAKDENRRNKEKT